MTGPIGPGRRSYRPEESQVIRRDPRQHPPPRRPPTPSTAAPRQNPTPPPRPPKPPAPPPPPKPVGKRKYRWRTWFRRIAVTLVVLMIVGLCGGAALAFSLDGQLNRVNALPEHVARPPEGSGTNWLLVGSDSRQTLTQQQEAELATGGDTGNGRTDTILLVHIPAFYDDGPTTMVSLPRDSYLPIPGYGDDKINSAFSFGGAPLLTQTVEQATGLRIDHYAEIGFPGFATLVDAVGGVTLCLDEPMDDPLAGIDLPAGCQNLNGHNALGYVRSRATPRADLDRMVHQRQFMTAILRRVCSPSVWLNPLRWYPAATAAAAVVTVANGDHVWDLAQLGWALAGSVQNLTMPIGSFEVNDSGDVVTWDDAGAAALFDALRSDRPVPSDLSPDPTTPSP